MSDRTGADLRAGLATALRQLRYERRAFWRNPAAAVFTIAFPVMFLVIFATLNSGQRLAARGGISYVTFFVPGMVAFGLISACYSNLAIRIAIARDAGVLKRIRGTPVAPWAYMAAQLASSVVTTVILTAVTIGIGVVAYGVSLRLSTLLGLVSTLALGAVCFCALGLAVSGLVPNADAGPAVVNFSIFPLLFLSGTFFPLDGAPAWLKVLTRIFPIAHLADGLQYAFDPRTRGLGFNGGDLVVLGAWAAGGLVLALRLFRWYSAV